MDNEILKNRVAMLMHAKGWTEAETAERSNTTQSTIHRIVSGAIASPRLTTLTRIARALGVSVSELTHPSEENSSNIIMEEPAAYIPKPESETIQLLETKKLNKDDYHVINLLIKHLHKKNRNS